MKKVREVITMYITAEFNVDGYHEITLSNKPLFSEQGELESVLLIRQVRGQEIDEKEEI